MPARIGKFIRRVWDKVLHLWYIYVESGRNADTHLKLAIILHCNIVYFGVKNQPW